jgi:hypothetical protein
MAVLQSNGRKEKQMNRKIRTALAAALGVVALAGSASAFAHGSGRHDGHRGHGWGHYKHHYSHHHHRSHGVYRERVIVHQPPPVIYEQRVYYQRPAFVIGVDLPPLWVQLR